MADLVVDPFRVAVTYHFELTDGATLRFDVDVDLKSQELKHYSKNRYGWTELECNKCQACPLPASARYCPAAVSIVDIIEQFGNRESGEACKTRVDLPRRSIVVEKTVQDCLFPLIGLRLATSLCPFLSNFKPMARFHEPFADPYYTVYRATSFYLLKLYFQHQRGGAVEFRLDGLRDFYRSIHTVNVHMAERLRAATANDATPNCIAILSVFDTSMTYFHSRYLEVLAGLFD